MISSTNASSMIPSIFFRRFLSRAAIPTSPAMGNIMPANTGAIFCHGPNGWLAAVPPAALTVIVIVLESWLVVGGLKEQVASAGRPLQLNVSVPRPGLESTWKSIDATPPCDTVMLMVPMVMLAGVTFIGGPTCVGSVAVSLPVLVSPPPETVAVLLKFAWMFCGTFTVSVIAG